jgi:hypothetical protein
MKRSLFITGVLLAAALAWAYLSPRLAAKRFRDAARARDVAALNEVVDFPAVREHLKADLNASLAERAARTDSDNPLGTALEVGGGALMVDGLVERFVSPRGIAALARYGTADSSAVHVEVLAMGYRDPSSFAVTVGNNQRGTDDRVTFVFHRSGLSWRLARLEIPGLVQR